MYFPLRKSIRLAPQNYLGYQFYFLTLCCYAKRKILVDPSYCAMVLEILAQECAQKNFAAHAYCLMPDHLHLLCEGLDATSDFLRFVTSFRIKTSRRFAQSLGGALWQRSYYEHIVRSRDEVELVAWYIWLNPVRKGLVSSPQQYPFSGSLTSWALPSSWAHATWSPPWKPVGSSF